MRKDQKDQRSEFGGDGKYRAHPLSASYNPPGDKEGATFKGLLPAKRGWDEES